MLENRQQQLARLLEVTERGSADELRLLAEQAQNATAIQLADNSAAQVGVLNRQQEALLAARKEIVANGQAEELRRATEFARQKAAVLAQAAVEEVKGRLASLRQGSDEEVAAQRELVEKQRQQQLGALEDRISAEERASQQRVINANAAQQNEQLTYQHRLAALQAFYQQERNQLEQAKAGGMITEQQYQDALFQQEIGALAARKQLHQSFNRDTAQDDQALTEKKIRHLQEYTDKERQARQQQLEVAVNFGQALGQLFADTVGETGATLEEFARNTILLVLDTLQKTILAAQVKILTEALATPDSIASFGITGFLRAGLIIASVQAAFGAVKSALAAPAPSKFAQGTVLGGASHAHGGTQLFGRDGHWYGEAEAGEAIINKTSTRLFLPVLSALNVAGGGKPLAPAPYMALGGVASPYVRESLAGPQVAPIDYDKLAAALQKVNLSVSVRDTAAAQARQDFTDRMANS